MNQKNLESEELSWIEDFKKGEEQGFNRLVLKHKNKVFRICVRMLGDINLADDCAQECFVKVWKGLPAFRGDSKFSSWLYRLVLNTCYNTIQSKHYKRNQKSVDFYDSELPDKSSNRSSAEGLEQHFKTKAIHRCMDKLDNNQRETIILRDLESETYEDISEILKESLGTIKSRLFRARQQLRHCLEGLL